MADTIILDTNAWMAIGQHHVPVFEEIERLFGKTVTIATLKGTITELEKIKDTARGKDKLAAKLSLQILAQKHSREELEILPIEGYVDRELIELSKEGDIILTADFELQGKLQKPYVIIRQHRFLELRE